jgi:hypothetical protein
MSRHWTLDELTDRMYGIREEDEHLRSCGECALRLDELHRRRAAVTLAPEVPPVRLATQRSVVLERIGTPSRHLVRWVPAVTAAACLLAVAAFVRWPVWIAPHGVTRITTTGVATSGVVTTGTAVSDAQLFADIYDVEESAEPRAAAPMHALFQEGQQ